MSQPLIPNARAAALQAAVHLPEFSVVLQRSLDLFSKGDDLAVRDVVKAIEQDATTGRALVSIANARPYARDTLVTSVNQAVGRLGIQRTRNALLGLSVTRLFKSLQGIPGFQVTRFNAHALASAILGDLVARSRPEAGLEWIFVTGLLHDVGLLLIAAGVPQCLAQVCAQGSDDYHLVAREMELLGFDHFELGAELLARWGCPSGVLDAVLSCRDLAVVNGPTLSLGAATKAASMLADADGVSTILLPHQPGLTTQLLSQLRVPDPTRFMATFFDELAGMTVG